MRDGSSRRDAWTARLVWSVWAALTVAALGLILELGVNIPFWDDWGDLVPFYAGDRPIDAGTLWRPHNEHRVPLTRLVQIGLGRATGYDFRAGALFSTVALSAASALLLRSARGVDGRMRLADCALPLLFLHWGQYMTLLWSYQVHTGLLVLLACVVLAIVLRRPDPPSSSTLGVYGSCLLALPLCQAGGVALAPVLALWSVAVAALDLRSPTGNRRRGWLALALAMVAAALAAVSYVAPDSPTEGNPVRTLWWSAVMLSTGFGVTERESQLLTLLLPAATAALAIATGVLVLRVARTQPRERLRAVGLGLFLLAFFGLALGIAWGRREGALSNRYPALAAPLLGAIYLGWRRYGPGRSGARVCAALCAVLVLLVPWNTAAGLRFARHQAETAAAFERDVRAGMPVGVLASRYLNVLHPLETVFRRSLRAMQDARIGVFRLREDQPR